MELVIYDEFGDVNDMRLELKHESWKNLFEVIRKSDIKAEGNFWASVQHLESQFDEWDKTLEGLKDQLNSEVGKAFVDYVMKENN
jgi:hypothetical protein